MASRLALAQGVFFIGTGLWPLVSLKTFEAVTGPKDERWLVKTVGVLVTAVGVALVQGRREPGPLLYNLGRLPALALAGIDLWYAGVRRRISPVYLVDAVVELGLAAAWTLEARAARRGSRA
ncbi:MAG TPA: hypothetical protein VHU40_20005 [Polyangia bacterium]|jgi:hypothetical protein|nr:hypothetical protein [Polyangia bacterium]